MIDIQTSVLQQEKRCIFCGNKPTDKNKEHVIPKWLISLTGDPKRDWYLGIKTNEPTRPERRFSADQFQFPACESCNTRYSDLEGRAKGYVERLLGKANLLASEWDDLLDWFDKIRIGLWIGNMTLNKDWPIPDPNFFIDHRLAKKDRCLLVYDHPNGGYVGLNITGASDPVIFHQPSRFMLVINGLIFINLSTEFLLSGRMGFPYPKKTWMEGNRRHIDGFTTTSNPRSPFIRFDFYPAKLAVYQTCLVEAALDGDDYKPLIDSEYVARKRLAGEPLKTQVCTVDGGKATFLRPDDTITPIAIPEPATVGLREHYIRLFEFRARLLDQSLNEQPYARKLIKQMKKFNGYALAQSREGIGSTNGLQPTVLNT